jgi:outer membrane protein OmpA-like peptidoglycan-associated protein
MPLCGGEMRFLAVIEVIERILRHIKSWGSSRHCERHRGLKTVENWRIMGLWIQNMNSRDGVMAITDNMGCVKQTMASFLGLLMSQRGGLVTKIVTAALFFIITTAAWATDLADTKDHPLLKRFSGSEIVGYDVKRFDEYSLQTSTYKRYNQDTGRREFAKPPRQLEGSVTRIWYEAANQTSSAELAGNYRNELKSQGFQIIYDSSKDPAAGKWIGFLNIYGDIKIKTNRSNYIFRAANYNGLRVLSAVKERPEGDIYVYLTAVEWTKNDTTYKAKQGAYAAVDIIEVRPMKQNMVVVKAAEMSKAITLHGKVALYGVFFDTDQATIKPESKATLVEIANLLKQEKNLSLHVVGHTDNTGSFEHNLDLSKRRANAVTTAISKEYGIDPKRLTPNGVANLAPVASNATEEGRAKNRRVELVPR